MRIARGSARYSINSTSCRYESLARGFSPALANSAAINWIATSDPRCNDIRPSSASEARKVRSARRFFALMALKPVAMRGSTPLCDIAATASGNNKQMVGNNDRLGVFITILQRLFQFFVLPLRLDQNWQVGVRALPQRKERLVILAALRRVTLQGRSPRQPQMRQRPERRGGRPAAMIEDRLKFRPRFCALAFAQPGLAAQIVLVEVAHAFIAASGFQNLDSLCAITALQFERGANQGQVDFVDQRVLGIPFDGFVGERLRLRHCATQRQRDASAEVRKWSAWQGSGPSKLGAALLAMPQNSSPLSFQ